MKLRRVAAITVAVGSVLVGTVVSASPASAAPGDGVPELEEFVLWRDANFTGPLFDDEFNAANYRGRFYVGTRNRVDNSASSAANYAPLLFVAAFTLPNDGGPSIDFLPHMQQSGAENWFYNEAQLAPIGFNNNISSHRFFIR
jgi:hypothetical protein